MDGSSFLDSLLTNKTRGLAALLATCEDAELKAEITEKARAAGHPDFAPKHPAGTPEYNKYRQELKVELDKFTAGEAPYEYPAQEAPVAIIVNPETILDGRTFRTYTGGYAEGVVTVYATTDDDVTWGITHLGQHVDGQRGGRLFRAYVRSVNVTSDDDNLITVLAEPL